MLRHTQSLLARPLRGHVLRLMLPVVLILAMAACSNQPENQPDVQATIRAEVANQVAKVPTATPWPTHTPYPTATAYPTGTPYPTGTAWPTHTPFPTATAYPTYTPYPTPAPAPTHAPLPTYTPYPTSVPATAVAAGPTATPHVPPTPNNLPFDNYAELDTTDRGRRILGVHILGQTNCEAIAELSAEMSRQFDTKLLKVYDMRILVSNSDRIECSGTGRWSRGPDSFVIVYVENDNKVVEPGEKRGIFYGYRFRSRGY